MKRFLCVILIAMTSPTWAQSAGFVLDDEPAARTRPAAPPRAPNPKQESNFIRCPNYDNKASGAIAMIQEVLKIARPVGKTLAASDGNTFTILRHNRDELQVGINVTGRGWPYDGYHQMAGFMCQLSDGGLKVKLVHDSGNQFLMTARAVSNSEVRLTELHNVTIRDRQGRERTVERENPRRSNVYSVQ